MESAASFGAFGTNQPRILHVQIAHVSQRSFQLILVHHDKQNEYMYFKQT